MKIKIIYATIYLLVGTATILGIDTYKWSDSNISFDFLMVNGTLPGLVFFGGPLVTIFFFYKPEEYFKYAILIYLCLLIFLLLWTFVQEDISANYGFYIHLISIIIIGLFSLKKFDIETFNIIKGKFKKQ
jgi:hypothetical protein